MSAGVKVTASDPMAFFRAVVIELADGTRARLGDVWPQFQEETFAAIAPALARVASPTAPDAPVRRLWSERLRGMSKTTDAALCALHALSLSCRAVRIVCVAVDQEQAGLLRNELAKVVRLNKALADLVRVDRLRATNRATGGELVVLSSDERSSYGQLADMIVCDEVSQWRDDSMWVSIMSTAAKRPHCVVLALLNAGSKSSWCWPIREAIRNDPRWAFSAATEPPPWMDAETIEEQRRLLPAAAFDRLWRGIWAEGGAGDLFAAADLTACISLPGPMRKRAAGWSLVCGVDLGVRRDASAAVVCGVHVGQTQEVLPDGERRPVSRIEAILQDIGGLLPVDPFDAVPLESLTVPSPARQFRTIKGSERLRLFETRVWKPAPGRRVSLGAVKRWLVEAHKRFGFRCVAMDPHQGERLAEELRESGVPVKLVVQHGNQVAAQSLALWEAVTQKRLRLFDDPDLLADLRRAKVLETSYGWRLVFDRQGPGDGPGTAHGDVATALSIAVQSLKRYRKPAGPPRTSRRLVFNPDDPDN